MISYEPVVTGSAGAPPASVCESALAQSDFNATVFGSNAVFGTKPSCKHFRHHDSKSVGTPASAGVPGVAAALGWLFGRFAGILPAPTRSLLLPVLTSSRPKPHLLPRLAFIVGVTEPNDVGSECAVRITALLFVAPVKAHVVGQIGFLNIG